MTNKRMQAYKTDMGSIPMGSDAFKATQPLIKWFGDSPDVKTKGNFTATLGGKNNLSVDNAYGPGSIQSTSNGGIWSDNGNHGWKLTATNGKEHSCNVEISDLSENRWMPCSLFNGFGFEYHASYESSSNHRMYMTHFGLILKHSTASSNYLFSTSNAFSSPVSGYSYLHFHNTNYIQEIRDLGSTYKLFGIIFRIYNSGSGVGSHQTTLKVFNLKFYHKGSTSSSNHRLFLPAHRSSANRDNPMYSLG